jgi:hypothetical protein
MSLAELYAMQRIRAKQAESARWVTLASSESTEIVLVDDCEMIVGRIRATGPSTWMVNAQDGTRDEEFVCLNGAKRYLCKRKFGVDELGIESE